MTATLTISVPDFSALATRYRVTPGLLPFLGWLPATLRAASKLEVVVDPELGFTGSHLVYEILVGDQSVAVDVSDYLDTMGHVLDSPQPVLKRSFTSWCSPHAHLIPLGECSFTDWAEFRRLRETVRYEPGHSVLHVQGFGWDRGQRGPGPRRSAARDRLTWAFPSRLDCEPSGQSDYFRRALRCGTSVHIPGSWGNSLDRAQWQLMGLGVCTVSPYLATYCLDSPPVPGEHYAVFRDDLSDLCDVVNDLLSDPTRAERIGLAASAFFAERGTPEAIAAWVGRLAS